MLELHGKEKELDYSLTLGVSKCSFAAIIWQSGGSPSFIFVCSASNRIFRKSALKWRLSVHLYQ